MHPDVLHLVLCDNVRSDPGDYYRLDILGLITSIRPVTPATFPVVQSRLLESMP
jgi:hypothetical protein